MNKKTGKLLLTLVAAFLLIFNGYAMTSDGKAYATENYNVYVQTDELVAGENYIITDKDSGKVHALSTDNAKATMDVTITTEGNQKVIYEYDPSMVFTMGEEGQSVNYIVNNGRYVVHAVENTKDILSFTDTQPSGITWTYNGTYLTYREGNNTNYLYYKTGTDYERYRIKSQSSVKTEYSVCLFKEVPYVSYDVTFNVENGKWDGDEPSSDSKTVKLAGPVGQDITLDSVPAVGENPNPCYKAGDWASPAPEAGMKITEDTEFTYSYAFDSHTWGEASYKWADDNSKVTGEHTCTVCGKLETEDAEATSEVAQATCTEPELTTWTSNKFLNESFEVRTKTEKTGEALGHTWGEAEYTWADNNSKVTGKHTCTVCKTLETEDADADSEVTQVATCELPEMTTWTSNKFVNESFEVQTKTEKTDEALGHDYHEEAGTAVDPTCTEDGKKANEKCSRCQDEKQGEVIHATGHKWDDGVVKKQATETAEGQKLFTCSVCGDTKTEAIPKLKPSGSDPNHKAADGTATGAGASAACAEKAITTAKSDADPAGSTFGGIKLRSTKQAKNSITLKWTKKNGAVKYVVYGNACGKNNSMKKLATLGNKNAYTVKKINKKLKKGTYHKFIVVALDKNDMVVSTSKIIHVATKGGKVTNAKSVTVKKGKKTVSKLAVKKGSTVKLKGTANKAIKSQTLKKHRAVTFESSNSKIATVTKSGKITAKAKGTCYIYAYAQNGAYKSIKVTVK